MLAELIRIQTADGYSHFGAFYHGKGSIPSDIGIVLVHGMTGSFVGEVEGSVPPILAEAGYSILVLNNRGNGILGAATERFRGCIPDINAAIDFMQDRGFKNIVLLGHSKGGVKVTFYLTETHDQRLVGLGILSPAANVHDIFHRTDFAGFGYASGDEFVEKCRELIAAGKGETFFTMPQWPYLVSAATVVDHTDMTGDDVLANLINVRIPVFALAGSTELEWCKVVATLVNNHPREYVVKVVDGADHVYTGKEPEVAKLLIDWFQKQGW